ncbi:hypothetical protein ACA910_000619 [Epithemia clementina (nom. ined.)]
MTTTSAASLMDEAAGGLAAGMLGTVIGYPLDIIKTRMQTSSSSSNRGRGGGGRGILATGMHIIRGEGMGAIYKGVGPPLLSLSILNTINFASYSYFHAYFHAHHGCWDARNALAGGVVGPIAASISTIENLIKTQMQLDNLQNHINNNNKRRYRNSLDCFQQIVRQHGAFTLYTGHAINTARETAFLSTYFFVYEGLRQQFANVAQSDRQVGGTLGTSRTAFTTTTSTKWFIPLAGGCAGAIAWAVSFPLDCVRAGVQGSPLQHNNNGHGQRRGSYQVVTQLLADKGIMGLYAGVGPSILRAFIVSGSRFSAYEGMLWLLRGDAYDR